MPEDCANYVVKDDTIWMFLLGNDMYIIINVYDIDRKNKDSFSVDVRKRLFKRKTMIFTFL